ncbi:hypothetical protein A3C98_00835 [Candidatus Roizmanbacteria bacterium RIFCSPHIGHO2_02_FULL_37_15]|nr:MAG: hypothetical protein A2859_03830 [Candidatus Roizmanbacteria bacterium RIFCSPHIGHO2_01_FULL_37_16b]OGK21369.1 MAG: hypothetical protein A3C98_00835 [Candidatus Roizmanbacteria bacterium RIFCSPHIGHO2_02_FULL_37_15]OGK33895.1 MAG: hypothetical protein A3F57_06265 [Candidatus Roizmanbacteria bacterium RIFCSPHIGHO2_12_FULL_36_11]
MLAHLMYERLSKTESTSARDELRNTLPDLFGASTRTSFHRMVVQNPGAIFYPNHRLGTLDTALSYFVQPMTAPFDELSIQLANYAKESGWVAQIGVHVSPDLLRPDQNNTFSLQWEGKHSAPHSTVFTFTWHNHTSMVSVDLGKSNIRISNILDRWRNVVVGFAQLGEAGEDIQKVQGRSPVQIAQIELTNGTEAPVLGLRLVERQEGRELLGITVPTAITVDSARLTQLITEPKYIRR